MFVASLLPLLLYRPVEMGVKTPSVDSPPRRARLVVAGDLMQHTPQLTAALKGDGEYCYEECFRYVAPYFQQADLAVVNLETTLSYDDSSYGGYPSFCSPWEVALQMRRMGVDVALLANNHCLDRGRKGVERTSAILDSLGIVRLGAYRDSVDYEAHRVRYVKGGNVRFALLNYTYGTNGIPVPKGAAVSLLDTLTIKQDMALVRRREVDCVVAFVHWGNEYERKPNASQLRMARWLKDEGVDLIIGSHPHTVQPFQVDDKGRIVVYSLGNFVSNQRKRYSDGGLVAVVDIEDDACGELKYYIRCVPVWVHRPHYTIMPPEVGDTIHLDRLSREQYEVFMEDTRALLEKGV